MRQLFSDTFDAMPTLAKKIDATGGNAAAISIAADAEQFWVLDRVDYSYDAAPTGGKLTIAFAGTTCWEVDITAAGPGFFDFSTGPLYTGTKNQILAVTLAAPGGSVHGKVNIRYR